MKLAEVLKTGVHAEIRTAQGDSILIGGKSETHRVEKVADDEQALYLLTVVSSGRHRGQKARVVLPYSSISQVLTFA